MGEDPILAPLSPTQLGLCKFSSHSIWLVPLALSNPDMISSQFFNQYSYVNNSPTISTDPLGLQLGCPTYCAAFCIGACVAARGGPVCSVLCTVACIVAFCSDPGGGSIDFPPAAPPPTPPPQPPSCGNGRKDC
jgi:hypothetical protein